MEASPAWPDHPLLRNPPNLFSMYFASAEKVLNISESPERGEPIWSNPPPARSLCRGELFKNAMISSSRLRLSCRGDGSPYSRLPRLSLFRWLRVGDRLFLHCGVGVSRCCLLLRLL